ncbi:RDD family protein [Pseudomonas beijingensis]|uniref:RDD family protein n=1 Tax=Pseudomonas beijingensis TaxID=2954101 RepID=UPI0034E1B015
MITHGNQQHSKDESETQKIGGLGRRWGGQIIDPLVSLFLFGLIGRTAELLDCRQTWLAFWPWALVRRITCAPMRCRTNGQSPGKKLLGMPVIDERSVLNCNLYQSFMRNIITPFLSIFDWILFYLVHGNGLVTCSYLRLCSALSRK